MPRGDLSAPHLGSKSIESWTKAKILPGELPRLWASAVISGAIPILGIVPRGTEGGARAELPAFGATASPLCVRAFFSTWRSGLSGREARFVASLASLRVSGRGRISGLVSVGFSGETEDPPGGSCGEAAASSISAGESAPWNAPIDLLP